MSDLRAAAQAVIDATDAYRNAKNGLGHPSEPHDRDIHMDPCTSDPTAHVYSTSTDCCACAASEYGTEDALNRAIGDLRAALGGDKKPWEARTQAEWRAALKAKP